MLKKMETLEQWLEEQVIKMIPKTIKSIVVNPLFLNTFNTTF